MALLSYAMRKGDDAPSLAIVTLNDDAQYLFASDGSAPFDGDRHLYDLQGDGEPPTDEKAWMKLASSDLQDYKVGKAKEFPSYEDAVADAGRKLAGGILPYDEDSQNRLSTAADAFDNVSQDYPGFAEDDTSVDPQAMLNYVMMALGPIDPEGPNGFLLRAQDGNPQPGDENARVVFPGTDEAPIETPPADDQSADPAPDDETAEPAPDDEEVEGEPA